MEISDEAKKRLANRVQRIVNDIDVYDAEKQEITRELTSHFYDQSMACAQKRGSAVIERQDVDAAFAAAEDPKEIAAAYMHSYVSSLQRAGLVSRTIAFVIDLIIFVVVIALLTFVLTAPFVLAFPGQFNIHFLSNPNGIFVEPNGPLAILVTFLVGTTSLAWTIVYFIVLEGRFGTTPGKWLLGLRVLKEDGTRIGYTEAIIRNIPKVVLNIFIVIDALLMLLVFNKEKQRGFDKIARTIVVHRKKWEG